MERRGVEMKKKVLVLGISVILAWVLICGCSGGNVPVSEGNSDISYGSANQDPKNPVFSKDYIAGVDFGGISQTIKRLRSIWDRVFTASMILL